MEVISIVYDKNCFMGQPSMVGSELRGTILQITVGTFLRPHAFQQTFS